MMLEEFINLIKSIGLSYKRDNKLKDLGI